MLSEQYSTSESLTCLVFMPMLKSYSAVRASVARSLATAGIRMCRLEVAIADAEWQYWLVQSVSFANFVLADVTDNNPFVMYELGVAHAQKLPVTLIVNSSNQRIPATVLGTPFLPYDNAALPTFESKLIATLKDCINALKWHGSAAIENNSSNHYSYYFELSLKLLNSFNAATSTNVVSVSQSEFSTRLKVAECRGDKISNGNSQQQAARYLLARIISNSDEIKVMQAVEHWLNLSDSIEGNMEFHCNPLEWRI